MKILIADDDRTSCMMLQATLKKMNYEVILVDNGLQAWNILRNRPPILALLDWNMPGMEGVEICRKLSQITTRNIPYRILITSRDSKKDVIYGLQSGAHDYITKPFDLDELLARINVGRRMIQLDIDLAKRVEELEQTLKHVKTLQGLLPICMHCHKIRNDQESWERIENYLAKHSEVQFSHGICPACAETYYSDLLCSPEQENMENN